MLGTVHKTLEGRADYFDIRVTDVTSTNIELKNNDVSKAVGGRENGACVRVLYNGAWGFAATPVVSDKAIADAADRAARIARAIGEKDGEKAGMAPVQKADEESVVPMKKSITDATMDMKLAYLTETFDSIKDYDFITSSTASYRDWISVMNFYSSEGTHVRTVTPRLIWTLEIVGKKDDNIQSVRRRVGATKGLELFDGDAHIKETRDAIASLVALLNGKKAPSGTLPVIVDPLLTGIFAHEAVGHAAEADLIMMGDSCFEGMLNKKIGSDIVTIKDDATIPGEFGSYVYDDEGVRTRPKPLIEDGYLKDYILSRETASRYGLEPNGGARAESYHGRPLVRMSNTYVDRGDASFKEMMEDMKLGVYVKGSRGGQVNTSQGFFQFNAQESYLIENGQITKPLRDVSLSGRTLEILKLIDMVGSDLTLGYCGFCGKGQTVPVGQGGPHIRISKCVVGGQ